MDIKDVLNIYVKNSVLKKTSILLFTSNLDYGLYDEIYKTKLMGYDINLVYVCPKHVVNTASFEVNNILNELLIKKYGRNIASSSFFHIFNVFYILISAPSTFKNFASHSGCAGQAGAVTKLPSTWALSISKLMYLPPAAQYQEIQRDMQRIPCRLEHRQPQEPEVRDKWLQ